MRKFFLPIAFFAALILGAADNFIKNADFKSLGSSGLPLQWQVRGNADGIRPFDGGALRPPRPRRKPGFPGRP